MVNWLADWRKASLWSRLWLPGRFKPVIGLANGLSDPVVELSMGQTAEVLVHRFRIEREVAQCQDPGPWSRGVKQMIQKSPFGEIGLKHTPHILRAWKL